MNSKFPYLLASACLGNVIAVLLYCVAYHHLWHKCLDETDRHTMCMMTLSEPYTIVKRGDCDWFVFKDRGAIIEQYKRGEISPEMAAHKLNEGFVVLAPPKEKFFGSMHYDRKRGWHVKPVHRCHGGPHG